MKHFEKISHIMSHVMECVVYAWISNWKNKVKWLMTNSITKRSQMNGDTIHFERDDTYEVNWMMTHFITKRSQMNGGTIHFERSQMNNDEFHFERDDRYEVERDDRWTKPNASWRIPWRNQVKWMVTQSISNAMIRTKSIEWWHILLRTRRYV